MDKQQLLSAIDFEIGQLREQGRLQGATLWGIGGAILALVWFLMNNFPASMRNFSDVCLIVMVVLQVRLVVQMAGNVIAIMCPPRLLAVRFVDLEREDSRPIAVRILLELIFQSFVFLAAWHHLSGFYFAAVFVYSVVYVVLSAFVIGLINIGAVLSLGKKHSGRINELSSLVVFSIIFLVISHSLSSAIRFEIITIGVVFYIIYGLIAMSTHFIDVVSRVNEFVAIRRGVIESGDNQELRDVFSETVNRLSQFDVVKAVYGKHISRQRKQLAIIDRIFDIVNSRLTCNGNINERAMEDVFKLLDELHRMGIDNLRKARGIGWTLSLMIMLYSSKGDQERGREMYREISESLLDRYRLLRQTLRELGVRIR